MTVAITRLELSASELREASARTKEAKVARRMLAIGLVLDDWSREAASEACGMDRQTLCDWVHRYNALGLEGLSDRPAATARDRGCRTSSRRRWRTGLRRGQTSHGTVSCAGAVLICNCGSRGYLASAARAHGGQAAAQAVIPTVVGASTAPFEQARGTSGFRRRFADLVTAALPAEALGRPVEIWFTDEARVGQQGTLTRVWAKRGSRPRALRDRRFEWAYLFGAICPERCIGAAIVMPEVNVEAMDQHLAEISRNVSVGAIALLVLDGAGWRSSPRLNVPKNIVLLPLPPYAPELNPMENVWEFMRGNDLSHRVWDGYEAIIDACCDGWNKLMRMPDRIASLTRRNWAQTVTG